MGRKARVGITADYIGEDGAFLIPGPGLKLVEERLHADYEVFKEFLKVITPEQIKGFDMVMTFRPLWKEESLAGNEQLLSIHRSGVGYERLDVPALTKAGIILTITPQAVRRPMASSIVAFILSLSLKMTIKEKLLRQGRWADVPKYKGFALAGKTLGSIGVGNIGHEMFRLMKPFGMRHIAYDPYVKQEELTDADVRLVDFETVLSESDVLNISCPLTEKTRHLIGEKELKKMKRTSVILNTARGPVIDEPALIRALQDGTISGAALDVFEQEPPSMDNPLFKLNALDNVILTPHAVSWIDQVFIDEWDEILTQMSRISNGEKPHGMVNPEVWNTRQFQAKLNRFLSETKK
jgi:D-3-phosphoglycerate dehydrogenase